MRPFKIKMIVEGNEEETFFEVVKTVGTHKNFDLEVENACGFGNISDFLLLSLREGDSFDAVICVYDVDDRVGEKGSPYSIVRRQLLSIFGDEAVVDAISFCTNPNILQYFLLAADSLDEIALKSTSKRANTALIHKYWPKIGKEGTDSLKGGAKYYYDANHWQLALLKESIIYETYPYDKLLQNASSLSLDYKNELPAGNLYPLLVALKNGNQEFFKAIRSKINETAF